MSNLHKSDSIYPWQLSQWQKLCDIKQKQRLPHALLLTGACGLGKALFAEALAHALLCSESNNQGEPCGHCHACHLIQAKAHPDLIKVAAEPPGQVIKVDQIREVVQWVNETSLQGGYRVIIIERAHQMNHNAANSLLKTLEEPPEKTMFVLLSGQPKRLAATITSRCQTIHLAKPSQDQAIHWLQSQMPDVSSDTLKTALMLSEGAPLQALTVITDDTLTFRDSFYQALVQLSQGNADPLRCAAEWHENNMTLFFHLLFYWLNDLLKYFVNAETSQLSNSDYADSLKKLAQKVNKEKVLSYLSHAQSIYAKITYSLNLNRQLLLEELLIRWTLMSK